MDVLAEIRQKLLNGKLPVELIKEGYAKSSVYYVAKKIRNTKSSVPRPPIDDSLTELRQRKEIIKVQKEIAELEAEKEQLPERVVKLEAEIEEIKNGVFDLWTKEALIATQKLRCPEHGNTMGILIKCKECEYEMGLGRGI